MNPHGKSAKEGEKIPLFGGILLGKSHKFQTKCKKRRKIHKVLLHILMK